MPIFQLTDDMIFPPAEFASENGILAVGGDLSPARLLLAYREGTFPWYSEGEPIIWWSPDPRFVLFPEELKIKRSMRQVLRKGLFTITYDRNFRDVVEGCRKPRKKESLAWITDEMREAYCLLHEKGFAHSVEAWSECDLVGGLYGVSLGRCFFGESMFSIMSNASKTALLTLTTDLQKQGFAFIDCQVYTEHLQSLGARMIKRSEYLAMLKSGVNQPTIRGNWGHLRDFP